MSNNIYKPTLAVTAASQVTPQIRLLLIGKPASGKSWAAATFPNPLFADFDNSCTSLKQLKDDILILPFYSTEFVREKLRSLNAMSAFLDWLATEAKKLTSEQTLVIDSLSTLQDAFHSTLEASPKKNAKGEDDGFYLWGEKIKYFRNIHMHLISLKCHVVVTAHEREIRDDKTGALLGKVLPSMSGSFCDRLGQFYTDIFHQFAREKLSPNGTPITEKDSNGHNVPLLEYCWQVRGDNKYDLKTRMVSPPAIVPATFASFKY